MARIFQTSSMAQADLLLNIVPARDMADLLVHRVSSMGLAQGDALWFITRNRQEATVSVHFTSRNLAQVTIFFVDSSGEAGWQKASLHRGRLGG